MIVQGGTVNTDAAARIVLTDWNDGRIPYYTEPPQRQAAAREDAAIVSSWGSDFDANQVSVVSAPLLLYHFCSTEEAALHRLHCSLSMLC
jgi:nuclear GTP-binding protein